MIFASRGIIIEEGTGGDIPHRSPFPETNQRNVFTVSSSFYSTLESYQISITSLHTQLQKWNNSSLVISSNLTSFLICVDPLHSFVRTFLSVIFSSPCYSLMSFVAGCLPTRRSFPDSEASSYSKKVNHYPCMLLININNSGIFFRTSIWGRQAWREDYGTRAQNAATGRVA